MISAQIFYFRSWNPRSFHKLRWLKFCELVLIDLDLVLQLCIADRRFRVDSWINGQRSEAAAALRDLASCESVTPLERI